MGNTLKNGTTLMKVTSRHGERKKEEEDEEEDEGHLQMGTH
jgi:hypothetical protein